MVLLSAGNKNNKLLILTDLDLDLANVSNKNNKFLFLLLEKWEPCTRPLGDLGQARNAANHLR